MEPAGGPSSQANNLAGLCVLVVEDDYFVANESASVLRNHGARVLGPVPDMDRARGLISEEEPDCVLLDVNLKGEMVYALAEDLLHLGIPAVFTTGYDASFLPATLQGMPCLQKPVENRELVRVVKMLSDGE
jgi:DNA-binding response OmpR family regulator